MKNRMFRLFGKSALPTLLAGALLAFGSPVAALAQGHGGGGHSGGRSFSSGGSRGFSGGGGHSGGRGFSSGGSRGFGGGGRAYAGGSGYGRGYGGGYYRGGGGYYGGGYGGGLYLGLGAPYAYGSAYGYAPAPAPCGFYDQAGYWQAGPCYGGPAGY